MIKKFMVLIDGKLTQSKFSIELSTKDIIITSIDYKKSIIKVPIYNKFNGIDYYPIVFPLVCPIINNYYFNPYCLLSSYSLQNDNEIDFFYNLDKVINIKPLNFKQLLDDKFINSNKQCDLFKIISLNYQSNINLENIKTVETNDLNILMSTLLFNLTLLNLCVLYILVKFPLISNKTIKEIAQKHTIPKKILVLANQLKTTKYKLSQLNNLNMTFVDYIGTNFLISQPLSELKPNNYYFISVNKNVVNQKTITEITDIVNDSSFVNDDDPDDVNNKTKIVKVLIKKISKNLISLSETKNLIYDNYKWYLYHPNTTINFDYIVYQTSVNSMFMNEIIKNLLCIENTHSTKLIDYWFVPNESKLSNLLILGNIFENYKEKVNDFNILKSNSYSQSFFDYIVKKYGETDKIYEIIGILFENYTYPLKSNRHELDDTFDNILYISIQNYKTIITQNKQNYGHTYDNIHPNLNSLVPFKVKNLYINILKTLTQIINNEYDQITYNQKFYYDYLHKNIIKQFLYSNCNKLSINLFKNLLSVQNYNKFKEIFQTNILLIDITTKLSWSNLPKRLSYLNYFYKNNNILYYQDKLNKNIISESVDSRIRKIIENPFEMYKFLRKEKDFIKWSRFIGEKLNSLYNIPISLSSSDAELIGKMIYLLISINEQNVKDDSYLNFINFCSANQRLILESNRVNLKIREYFPNLKSNINLGFLAKHLTWEKDMITFDDNINKTPEVLALEMKLHMATKKYYKYKAKYLESKDIDVGSALIEYKKTKISGSETSSVMPTKESTKLENLIDT